MSLISKWYSTTLDWDDDSQNTPEVDLQDAFEAIEIDIPTLSAAAEVQIKGANVTGGTFDLIGQEEPIPSSTGGFRTTVPLGGKYRYIKVYCSAAQTADRVFAVRGVSYASAGLVALIDRIKNMRIDVGDIEVNTQDIEDILDEIKVLIGEVQASPTENSMMDRLKEVEDGIDELKAITGVVTGSPTTYTVLERLKVLATALALITNAEDAAHSSGDSGTMALGVRSDSPVALGADGDYVPQQQDALGNVRVVDSGVPMFGAPVLRQEGVGVATWVRRVNHQVNEKGATGWTAKLLGGVQTNWDDAACVDVPVNELPLASLTDMLWTYYMTNDETYGCQVDFWVHDPTDNDKRANIIQQSSHASLGKSQYWNAHELVFGTSQFFFYAENDSGQDICVTEGPGGVYSLTQFQTDAMFKTWTIYRIAISSGYNTGVTQEAAYVADIKINGQQIQLKPSIEEQLEIVRDDQAKALTTIPTWTFGTPTLRQSNSGQASWSRYQYQKGGTGWNAKLEGGAQSGDDWASMFVSVNELPLSELKTVLWSYLKADSVQSGIALEIWAHDPTDFSKRAEIGQTMGAPGWTAGWHSEELTTSDDEFKWWGENVTDADSVAPGTCTTTNTNYTWAEYMSDSVFATWTIYRIEFVIGWIGSGTLLPAHLAEVVINGTAIPLGPKSGKSSVDVLQTKTLVGGARSALDVLSESIDAPGTDWDFDMGASGYVTKAIVTAAVASATERLTLYLFTVAPTGETNDNVANNSPIVADIPYLVGWIDFPALEDTSSAAMSQTIATPSTVGNLPLAYKGPVLYGILIGRDGGDLGNVLCSIHLFADIQEDN